MYIKTKISLNFLLMSLLMIGTGLGYLFTATFIQRKLEGISRGTLPSMQKLSQIRESVWEIWDQRADDLETSRRFRDLEKQILEYRALSLQDNKENLAVELRQATLELQETFDAGDYRAFAEGAGVFNRVISKAMTEEGEVLLTKSRGVASVADYANWVSVAFIAVAFLFCLLPGWWLANSISKALANVSRAADRIAAGDLTERLDSGGEDEISELASAFNRMVETIREADEEITREVEDRVRAERKAQIAAKAKSDFLAHMSHEFRTPLNGILGYSQMLLMDEGLSEKNREVVRSLRKSGESLLELINDVLDLTKIEAQKMNVQKTRFYLGDFLESLVEGYAEQVKRKGLEFRVQLDENLPEDILSDQIRMRQILVNLLGNAIKFTDKGYIGMEVKPVEGGIRFSVFDSGIGISPEDQPMVMQPFQQVGHPDRNNPGTGLGLSISNRLLEMMGTHLSIKSAVGEGTTFWFDLPQPDVKYRKLVHSPTRIIGYRGKARKILIGEEGVETASLLTPLLQKVGFEVLHLRSPEILLEKCRAFQPDVVLIALYFGEVDGVGIMGDLQRNYDREPGNGMPAVFLFSDHRKPDDRERALRGGARVFLGVPIRFTDLLVSLKEELELVWIETDSDGGDGRPAGAGHDLKPPEEVLPDTGRLQELLELAKSGNVRQLSATLRQLKDAEPEVSVFADRLLLACGKYQINAMQKELETLLNTTAADAGAAAETSPGEKI